MHLERKLFTAIWVMASCMLIVGCDGGSEDAASTTKVSASESPIPNTSGLKIEINTSTNLFIVGETNSDARSIEAINPQEYNATPSAFYGESFYKISASSGDKGAIVFSGGIPENIIIRGCSIKDLECSRLPYRVISDTTIEFVAANDMLYALEKK